MLCFPCGVQSHGTIHLVASISCTAGRRRSTIHGRHYEAHVGPGSNALAGMHARECVNVCVCVCVCVCARMCVECLGMQACDPGRRGELYECMFQLI